MCGVEKSLACGTCHVCTGTARLCWVLWPGPSSPGMACIILKLVAVSWGGDGRDLEKEAGMLNGCVSTYDLS
jgi:hypothetical protein